MVAGEVNDFDAVRKNTVHTSPPQFTKLGHFKTKSPKEKKTYYGGGTGLVLPVKSFSIKKVTQFNSTCAFHGGIMGHRRILKVLRGRELFHYNFCMYLYTCVVVNWGKLTGIKRTTELYNFSRVGFAHRINRIRAPPLEVRLFIITNRRRVFFPYGQSVNAPGQDTNFFF